MPLLLLIVCISCTNKDKPVLQGDTNIAQGEKNAEEKFIENTLITSIPNFGQWRTFVGAEDGYIEPDEGIEEVIKDGRAYIPPSLVDIEPYWTKFELDIPNHVYFNGDNIKMEVRLKCPLSEGGIRSRDVELSLKGKSQMAYVVMMGDHWGQPWAKMGVGTEKLENCPSFVQDFEEYVIVAIKKEKEWLEISYNGIVLERLKVSSKVGFLDSFFVAFKGSGSIDWIKIYENNKIRLEENFNTNGKANIIYHPSNIDTN